jgi:hypothetical protein
MKITTTMKLIILVLSLNINSSNALDNPIMFVTQYPIEDDFSAIGTTFGNHQSGIENVGRGGDLYIRYADGTLRNLTREAGFGMVGFQGVDSIAVRDPTIHWNGTKALFSMVIGATAVQFGRPTTYWQMYEITGFGQGQTISITKVASQPSDYNNITPIYDSSDNIVFTTDMPRTKNRYNYPQYDEYDNDASTTGLWQLNRITGEVKLLQHAPSGSFSPLVDKAGRIVFTRWDHLERDQQAYTAGEGHFNYSSELPGATAINSVAEIFPEPQEADDPDVISSINLHSINHFFPWQLNQDGTVEETLNHVGRHELHGYFTASFNTDASLFDFIPYLGRPNVNVIRNTFMLDEDPNQIGRYIAIDAPEFGTYNAGQIIAFALPLGARPDLVTVDYLTHPDTRDPGNGVNHSGFYRDAITLADGIVLSSHTSTTHSNNTAFESPFTIKSLSLTNGYLAPDTVIANLPNVTLSFWSPDVMVNFTGQLWQFQPVEVIARSVPPITSMQLETPELQVMSEENVDVNNFQNYLRNNNLAVVVMRDVTTRDSTDQQQPFNLRVPSSGHQTIGDGGQIYDISHLQFVQADQVRGIGGAGGANTPRDGQRPLAQFMHDDNVMQNNISFVGAPPGSVEVYPDGSVAAFVPTRRAMAWQSVAPDASPVVRERYWVSFQPGEIRACAGCHGINDVDQAGNPASTQKAEAFRALLQHWKQNLNTLVFSDGFE